NILAFKNTPSHFLKILCSAFVPSKLLRTRSTNNHRKLRRRFHFFQIFEFPVFKLCTVTEVEVFSKGVALPIPCVQNTFFTPNTRRSVEIYEMSFAVSSNLLQSEMCIERKSLYSCEN